MKYFIFLVILSIAISCQAQVTIIDEGISEGQDCFKIVTPTATYIYQKQAGGFSNIYDANGVDWVQFHKTDSSDFPRSSASEYRGLPNLVYDGTDDGCGHPGFNKMTSEQISVNQIRSTSENGKWQWSWIFYEDYAEFVIEQTDSTRNYWFLYEGPIAGEFNPNVHYWGNNVSGFLKTQGDHIKGSDIRDRWQTIYLGSKEYDQTFFVKQIDEDTLNDMYSFMGNTMEGNSSPDGMVVVGFGRGKGVVPLLSGNQKFIIGFYNQEIINARSHSEIITYINKLTTN